MEEMNSKDYKYIIKGMEEVKCTSYEPIRLFS